MLAIVSGYTEDPQEYEAEGVSHIDYEQDQLAVKMQSNKVKRNVIRGDASNEYEGEGVKHIFSENNQTPAEDRNWQVKPKPKPKRMAKGGKKVHIYLKNEEQKGPKPKKPQSSSTTSSSTTVTHDSVDEKKDVETQTRRAPEATTRKSDNLRNIEYTDKDSIPAGSSHSNQAIASTDSETEPSDHHTQVIKEKIKIKHHHHHHHHNHVKTVVKKEPFPVEKIVHVPVEKIVEKKVPYKVEVEKIVEKVSVKFV